MRIIALRPRRFLQRCVPGGARAAAEKHEFKPVPSLPTVSFYELCFGSEKGFAQLPAVGDSRPNPCTTTLRRDLNPENSSAPEFNSRIPVNLLSPPAQYASFIYTIPRSEVYRASSRVQAFGPSCPRQQNSASCPHFQS
jgi:hypothetical protein